MTLAELQTALKENKSKIIFGTDRTIKLIKTGKVSVVYIASNCPLRLRKQIEYYEKLGAIKVNYINKANDELGVICKRPFSINILSY